MSSVFHDIQCWMQSLVVPSPSIVGIYALPRGGSNFLSAWMHYHPEIFAVSERYLDWKRPLWQYWTRRSILRRHGVQNKSVRDTRCIIFNKVQRNENLWGATTKYPETARMIFYLRNPVEIFYSREILGKIPQYGVNWAATKSDLDQLLDEIDTVIKTYRKLKNRLPCLLLGHEYFCCDHLQMLPMVYRFLGVRDDIQPVPREFLRRWESVGPEMDETKDGQGTPWLVHPQTHEKLQGYGGFNPLRPIDVSRIKSDRWKNGQDIEMIIGAIRARFGDDLVDYYWNADYSRNLDDLAIFR